MKLLVTGSKGQLGTDVVGLATQAGLDFEACDRDELDLADAEAVASAIARIRPDAVLNCAAFTAVDRCETESEAAFLANETAVGYLAQACADNDAHLVHVSTDYVFDGTLDRAYVETDTPNPQSVYGASKLAGEVVAQDLLGDGVSIARTSWVCGAHGNNMLKTVRRLAAEGNEMAFVDDQRGCPTFTADLAAALLELVADRPGGIFHLTNAGAVSWFEFVQEILSASGYPADLVRPISTAELDPPRPAQRPMNSVLDNAAWRESGRTPLRDFRAALADAVTLLG